MAQNWWNYDLKKFWNFGKLKIGVLALKIYISKPDGSTSSNLNSTNTGPINMFFSKKKVTTYHGKQDGIINFCLIPNWRGVSALLTFKSTGQRSLIDTVYVIYVLL